MNPDLVKPNVCVLRTFPQSFINEAKAGWDSKNFYLHQSTKNVFKSRSKRYYYNDNTFIHNWFNFDEELKNDIEDIRLLYSFPNTGRFPCHTDSYRNSAINIPIVVPEPSIDNSFMIATSGNFNDYKSAITKTITDGKYECYTFRNKNDNLFSAVIMKRPILFNPRMPHYYYNKSNSIRVVLSIGFLNTTFDDLLKRLPDEWIQ